MDNELKYIEMLAKNGNLNNEKKKQEQNQPSNEVTTFDRFLN